MRKEIDTIKESVDIVEFLKSYIDLSPTGKNFKALCPFHQEKTPSFFVSPEKKIWHCFGCGLGGDVIRFVMLYEHLEFPEALKIIAEKTGIQIPSFYKKEQKEFDVLYNIHQLATEFYKSKLKNNQKALNYLKSRGLKEETIDYFNLGYAPEGDELTKFLFQKKYNVNEILKTGLAYKINAGLLKDKFQNRIIFPIYNQIGKVVAFTGRIFEEKDLNSNLPKYLNSPETLIFNKSKILYGFEKAKEFISKEKKVIIVEGQFDFLLMWQEGFKNVVALSGTGLTEEHLFRLRKIADTIFIAFDKDEAGIKALERSLLYFYNFDFFVKVLDLKNYKDPAEICQKDKVIMQEIIEKSKGALEYLIDFYIENKKFHQLEIPLKKNIINNLLFLINLIKNSVEKDLAIKYLSEKSKINESSLREQLNLNPELKEEKLIKILETEEKDKQNNLFEEIAKKLYILSLTNEKFKDIIKDEFPFLPQKIQQILKDEKINLNGLLELEAAYLNSSLETKIIEKEFKGLIKKAKILNLKEKIKNIKEEIKKIEKEANKNKSSEEILNQLIIDFNKIRKELDNLMKS